MFYTQIVDIPRKNTLQTLCLVVILLYPIPEKQMHMLKPNPMRRNLDTIAIPTGKIYLKLALFGCFLIGFAYASLLLLNYAWNLLQ